MIRFKKVLLVSCVLAVATGDALADCPVKTGDNVSFLSPENAYDLVLKKIPPPKGEFETTAAYEQRISGINSGIKMDSPVLVEIQNGFNPTYDADRERFVFTENTFNGYISWWSALSDDIMDSLRNNVRDNPHGVELKSTETLNETYDASNAYGLTISVEKYKKEQYALFDKYTPRKKKTEDNWQAEFEYTRQSSKGEFYTIEAIAVPVPLSEAPSMKSKMRMGVFFTPKHPLTHSNSEYSKPSRLNPKEVFGTVNVMFGDIHCAVITDEDSKILKTVNTAY